MRLLFFVFCLIFLSSAAEAQWSTVRSIDDNNLYKVYGLQDGRILLMAEKGDIYLINQSGEFLDTIDLQEYGFLTSNLSTEEAEYVGGGCYFVTEGCPGHALYESLDGGDHWQEVNTEATFTGFGSIAGILPVDKNHLVVLKEYEGIFKINKITGAAEEMPMPAIEGSFHFINAIYSDDGKWAIQLSRTLQGQTQTLVYESTDQGLSWDHVKLADEWDSALLMAYRKDNSLQLIGSTMKVFRYADKRTKLLNTLSVNPFEEPRAQYIIGKNYSYVSSFDRASGNTFIYRSSDGGRNWEIDLSSNISFYGHMIFSDRNNGLAISGFNTLLKREGPIIQDLDDTLVLFPNPVRSQLCLNLTFHQSPEYQVVVHDMIGREMLHRNLSSPVLDVSMLDAGFYLLSVLDKEGGRKALAKFCKQ